MGQSDTAAATLSFTGLGIEFLTSALPHIWPNAPMWLWWSFFLTGLGMMLAYPAWFVRRAGIANVVRHPITENVFVVATLIFLFIVPFVALWLLEEDPPQYAPFDRNGTPVEQGFAECDYQAELASLEIHNAVAQAMEQIRLTRKCMAARGY